MSGRCSVGVLQEVLRQALRPPSEPTEQAWTEEQWCEAFTFLFLAAPGSRHTILEHQDDMLWFVTSVSALGAGTPSVTLRRNTSAALPPEYRPGGASFASIDWARSVQLNLVVQAKYILTVVQCRQDALATVAQGQFASGHHPAGPLGRQPRATVVAQRRVYASPMAADVNLEETKSGKPLRSCYPDICFAVDNFEDAFQDMVLSAPGDCYCVMLHVHAAHNHSNSLSGDAAASASPAASSTSAPASLSSAPKPPGPERRGTLFSAYVTQDQVANYLASRAAEGPRPSLLSRLFGGPRTDEVGLGPGRWERVVMSGPSGVGRAEVVAAPVPGGGGTARVEGGNGPPLQLSLLWMSLPAAALAHAVLQFGCDSL